MTIKQAISFALNKIKQLDAELLLCHILRKDNTWLFINENYDLSSSEENEFKVLVEKRQNGSPVAHLTGIKEFYGRNFKVTPDTLIPRPETEELVGTALQLIEEKGLNSVIDIGTGSGCIGLTIKLESQTASVTCTDISSEALAIAAKNANNLGAKVEFIKSDLLESLPFNAADLLIANLPYIAENDPEVAPEVALHEPAQALYSGETGLAHYERLLNEIAAKPFAFKYAIFEFGYRQASDLAKLLAKYPEFEYEIHKDLSGHDRYAIISQKANKLTS